MVLCGLKSLNNFMNKLGEVGDELKVDLSIYDKSILNQLLRLLETSG